MTNVKEIKLEKGNPEKGTSENDSSEHDKYEIVYFKKEKEIRTENGQQQKQHRGIQVRK